MKTPQRWLKHLLEAALGREIRRFGNNYCVIGGDAQPLSGLLYEAEMQSLIRDCGINLVLDVGANRGQFVKGLRCHVGYEGQVISFEPLSATFRELENAARGDPLWQVCNFALGKQNADQTLNVSQHSVFSSFLQASQFSRERFGDQSRSVAVETVKVRRLDEVLSELVPNIASARIFLKLDTQGYDLQVFAGLGDKVASVEALQSEISLIPIYEGMPHWTESVSVLEDAEFRIAGFYPVNRHRHEVIEFDCIMVKAKSDATKGPTTSAH